MKQGLCDHPLGLKSIRGVCSKCYTVYRTAVKNKETTWEQLVKEGKVLAPAKPKPCFFGRRH